MANKNNAAPGGCGVVILIGIGIWALMWVLKIALIALGGLLVMAGVVGAIGGVIALWTSWMESAGQRRRAREFDRDVDALLALGFETLHREVAAWDEIQLRRGVGTTLETAYFSGTPTPDQQRTLHRVNELITTGESIPAAIRAAPDRSARIGQLTKLNRAALELEKLRATCA